MQCQELEGFVDAYLDGEFAHAECSEVEHHLQGCAPCRALAARQARLRELVRDAASAATAPEGLRERVFAGLDQVDAEGGPVDESVVPIEAAREAANPPNARRSVWGTVSVAASVAGVTMFLWISAGGFGGGEAHIDDVVAKHSRGLPVEVSEPDPARLRGWMRGKVDFNPRILVFPDGHILRTKGVRLTNIGDRPAIQVSYDQPGADRGASLFAFPDPQARLAGRRLVKASAISPHGDVHLDNRRGYSVVMWKENEIVYELVSDLDDATVLELVKSAQTY